MFSSVKKISLSQEFNNICVRIGECKSREEEQLIVSDWMKKVRANLGKQKVKIQTLYESVVSLLHLSLLGYDTSFGNIQAVNLTQENQMMPKALGYLACSTLLDSKSDILIMIINSTQRDLSSGHPTSMALALTAICHLVTADLIPPIISFVGQALNHSVPLIRQKAVMCINSFIKKDPSTIIEYFPDLIRLLSDPDLSIVNAVVNCLTTLLRNTMNIQQICECLPDVANVVSAIQQGHAKTEYIHQRVLAPFILVNIFKFFQVLAPHMPELAENVAPLLTYALQNGTNDFSAPASVLYEAIRSCIVLNLVDIPQLRGAISMFMSSDNQNYKYIGIGLLQSLPDFADEFQSTIIDCLEHPDASIRLRTLGLLHTMACESNAQIIVVNMLKFFQRTKNERVRTELADRITSIASQFSPSPLWFAKTMEQLFVLGGDNVRPEIAFAVLKLIEENCDEEMRKGIVNLYIDVAQSYKRLSDVFVIVVSRVIGMYAELSDEYDLNFIALLLCDLADAYEGPREWVLNALLMVVSKLDEVPQQVSDVFENYKQSKSIIAQEVSYEALALLLFKDALIEAETPEVPDDFDKDMTFLDDYVADAIENKGAKEYIPLEERDTDLLITPKSTIKYTYNQETPSVYGSDPTTITSNLPVKQPDEIETGLNTSGVKMVWGENGLQEETEQNNNEYGSSTTNDQPAPESPKVSIFKQLSLNRSNQQQNQKEAHKEKMKESLFGGLKKTRKTPQSGNKSLGDMNSQQQTHGVYNTSVSLTEEDYQKLEKVNYEISQPMPQPIQAFLKVVQLHKIQENGLFRVSAGALNGSVVISIENITQQTPVMDLSVQIIGPEALIKEGISHPKQINILPPQQTIYQMMSYKFPTQMSGFPEFNFSCVIQYNKTQKLEYKLPMNLTTFIIPGTITTPQFGQFWKQGGKEIVFTMQRTSTISIDDVSHALNNVLHVKTVERIGTEEILFGTLFSTPFKILVHVKFGATKIDMKVLTKVNGLTQSIVNTLKTIVFP
ncbi:Adaptin N terminal region family protein [Histomonas meleagridis]|uniref:Adaptin N terminal region family protein n=1 Tax=Histomonas meleagridis TaxID=135588 RepID=UPI00355ABE38|nr:Adaptin N terminal region family protein [Histomonas meleagridis]KAH0805446.1 Adaptin N terminal region family protein [Histomonas meleagridis]